MRLQQQRVARSGTRMREPHEVRPAVQAAQPHCSQRHNVESDKRRMGAGTSNEEEHGAFRAVAAGDIGRHVRGTVTRELREEVRGDCDGDGDGDGDCDGDGVDDDLQANIFIHLCTPRVVAGDNQQVS